MVDSSATFFFFFSDEEFHYEILFFSEITTPSFTLIREALIPDVGV
jgi:hypothetical protein